MSWLSGILATRGPDWWWISNDPERVMRIHTQGALEIWNRLSASGVLVPTTLVEFQSMLAKYDPEGLVYRHEVDLDTHVMYLSPETKKSMIRAYRLVTLDLCARYGLVDATVLSVYDSRNAYDAATFGSDRRIELNMRGIFHRPVHSVHDSILHEIAHLLAFGSDDNTDDNTGHGNLWRKIAVTIGSRGTSASGQMHVRYMEDSRYEDAIVFRCVDGCFAAYEKSCRDDLLADCDPLTGALKATCDVHGNTLFLHPPPGKTLAEYYDQLKHERYPWVERLVVRPRDLPVDVDARLEGYRWILSV